MSVFKFTCLVSVLAIGLSGCVEVETRPVVPDVPPGTPSVTISNGGSFIYGGNSAVIYQGDIVVYSYDSGAGGPGPRETFSTLRAGGYDRLRVAALELIEDTAELVGNEPGCHDYGADLIQVADRDAVVQVAAGCPDNPVTAAQGVLRTLLGQEIAE